MPPSVVAAVTQMIEDVEPVDDLAAQHRTQALQWLASTTDIFRRAKPRTPSPHLVSYFLLVDRNARQVLLCDHRLSGLWLPTGGHVEPGEHPVDTVRREAFEELGIQARFHPGHDHRPFFLTVTDTVGSPEMRHTDVSLWFALDADIRQALDPDEREFIGVRWFSEHEIGALRVDRVEPHLARALRALDQDGW